MIDNYIKNIAAPMIKQTDLCESSSQWFGSCHISFLKLQHLISVKCSNY